jgi:hypothetical protein
MPQPEQAAHGPTQPRQRTLENVGLLECIPKSKTCKKRPDRVLCSLIDKCGLAAGRARVGRRLATERPCISEGLREITLTITRTACVWCALRAHPHTCGCGQDTSHPPCWEKVQWQVCGPRPPLHTSHRGPKKDAPCAPLCATDNHHRLVPLGA